MPDRGLVSSDMQEYYYNNNKIKIASKFLGDSSYDLVQEWKYCLQGGLNTIFTFYNVKILSNPSPTPMISSSGERDSDIMTQSGDCILPARINEASNYTGASEYCSGYHSLAYKGKNYKTAETIAVRFLADGMDVKNGERGYAKELKVIVTSLIYNPFTLLNSLNLNPQKPTYETIIEEEIIYSITNGNILCDVIRSYKGLVHIEAYGGFASMAMKLNYAYFPCGADMINPEDDGFGKLVSNIGFNHECDKKIYPDFNHFIRRNPSGTIFETVFLFNSDSGNHDEIPDDYSMYWVYNAAGAVNKKVYHRITYHKTFDAGDIQRMRCRYSWYLPASNTEDYIVSQTGDYIFIDIKGSFTGVVPIPDLSLDMKFVVYQKTNAIKQFKMNSVDGNATIEATGKGSIILRQES